MIQSIYKPIYIAIYPNTHSIDLVRKSFIVKIRHTSTKLAIILDKFFITYRLTVATYKMGSKETQTWLEKLEEQRKSTPHNLIEGDTFELIIFSVNVDVDWMDPEYIKGMPIKPHDQTSNQLWVDIQLGHPSNAALLVQTAKELKDKGWLAIYTRMVLTTLRSTIFHKELHLTTLLRPC